MILALALVVFAAACDWPQYLYGPERTGFSPDTSISAADITGGPLAPRWTSVGSGAPVVAGGLVFQGGVGGGVGAFDARGVTNCSGSTVVCSPRWTAVALGTSLHDPAVAGNVLVATGFDAADNGVVAAFDARGATNCSGTPKVCSPLWTATTFGSATAVTLAGGVVYQASDLAGVPTVSVVAYDVAGVRNCSGVPVVCSPLWSAMVPGHVTVPPSISNGVAYLVASTGLYAFDAAGTANCAFLPVTCSPLWVGGIPGGPASNAHAVIANGTVFIAGATPKNVYGFDAAGSRGCSATLGVCQPVWTAAQAGPNPSVAGGKVYVNAANRLAVFDATGTNGCQGTTVKTCAPLWSYSLSSSDCYWTGPACGFLSPPVIANGVVYQGYFNKGTNGLTAYDATGTLNCAGTPKTCGSIGFWFGGSPTAVAVSNGFIYNPTFENSLVALGLP
jgi:hypothetical protein